MDPISDSKTYLLWLMLVSAKIFFPNHILFCKREGIYAPISLKEKGPSKHTQKGRQDSLVGKLPNTGYIPRREKVHCSYPATMASAQDCTEAEGTIPRWTKWWWGMRCSVDGKMPAQPLVTPRCATPMDWLRNQRKIGQVFQQRQGQCPLQLPFPQLLFPYTIPAGCPGFMPFSHFGFL